MATQWWFSPKSFLTITADVSLEVSSLSITLVDSVHPKSAVENNLLFPTDLVSTISFSGALCYDENGSYKYFHIRESYEIPHSATKEKEENISWKFYKKIQSSKERRISLMYKKNSKQGQEKKRILQNNILKKKGSKRETVQRISFSEQKKKNSNRFQWKFQKSAQRHKKELSTVGTIESHKNIEKLEQYGTIWKKKIK